MAPTAHAAAGDNRAGKSGVCQQPNRLRYNAGGSKASPATIGGRGGVLSHRLVALKSGEAQAVGRRDRSCEAERGISAGDSRAAITLIEVN